MILRTGLAFGEVVWSSDRLRLPVGDDAIGCYYEGQRAREYLISLRTFPQRLEPRCGQTTSGTAEAVLLTKPEFNQWFPRAWVEGVRKLGLSGSLREYPHLKIEIWGTRHPAREASDEIARLGGEAILS